MSIIIDEKEVILPQEYVLTYGKDITVVKEDAQSGIVNGIEELILNEEDSDSSPTDPTIEEQMIQPDAETSSVEASEEIALKAKQVDLLLGKAVKKDIFDRFGNLFVQKGTVLTEELIKQAQEIGFDLVIQLSMSVEV